MRRTNTLLGILAILAIALAVYFIWTGALTLDARDNAPATAGQAGSLQR